MEFNNNKPSPSEAHPDTMDFLSREWCNFAVQSLQPNHHHHHHHHHDHHLYHHSIVPLQNSIPKCQNGSSPVTCANTEKSMKIDDSGFKPSIPPWKTNDVKSWIWMQQAMHPELNYNGYFRRKFKLPWSIKKWWKEIKEKRKEEKRLQRAEVQAAVSVAGLAAALAAVAAENAKNGSTAESKEAVVASAAAVVASQCAQVAESMGANRNHLSSSISSAMAGTSLTDLLTLTASATTSLRGAETLKARTGCKMNGTAPVLPIEDSSDFPSEFNHNNTSLLAKGTHLFVETPDGDFKVRTVSVVLNSEGKVILVLKKPNLLKSKKESVVTNVHVELYKDSEGENNAEGSTCYLIVLRTNRGVTKLDMGDDYDRYKTWVTAINHMLALSTPAALTNYTISI
ncbi:PREDICTED: VAN3-binding protein [Tarenaya hassleriana]|uniref:VAN3-binding protein n=1 Tax=Tarenaya hassleriana TaxID=28532 RepID=UPI00053C7544|nr:PREDICTED: VAN3-binding protein [Tarenaya hassleriana]